MAENKDAAKQARADRRQAERDARIRTGKPAASVTPPVLRAIRRNARNN